MHILSSIILCTTLFYTFNFFAMQEVPHETAAQHCDIRPLLCKKLSHEDQKDFRLVCKAWARKDKNWDFMPDDLLKETNTFIQKRGPLTADCKTIILAKCIAANNYNSVKWILTTTSVPKEVFHKLKDNQKSTIVDTLMLAKGNDNKDIAHLLIQYQYPSFLENWKKHYNELTVYPLSRSDYFNAHEFDFTFSRCVSATLMDDNTSLQQLPLQQLTTFGFHCLVKICCELDNIHCFNFLLNHPTVSTIMKTYKDTYLSVAQQCNAYTIIQILDKFNCTNKPDCIIQ